MSRSIKSVGVPSPATSGAEESREHRHPGDPQVESLNASLDSELLWRLATERAAEVEAALEDAMLMFSLIEDLLAACPVGSDDMRRAKAVAEAMVWSVGERSSGASELVSHVAELRARAAAPFAGALQ